MSILKSIYIFLCQQLIFSGFLMFNSQFPTLDPRSLPFFVSQKSGAKLAINYNSAIVAMSHQNRHLNRHLSVISLTWVAPLAHLFKYFAWRSSCRVPNSRKRSRGYAVCRIHWQLKTLGHCPGLAGTDHFIVRLSSCSLWRPATPPWFVLLHCPAIRLSLPSGRVSPLISLDEGLLGGSFIICVTLCSSAVFHAQLNPISQLKTPFGPY